MSHRPQWTPGPGPGPDGLTRAFRAAERRRLRTAAASASAPAMVVAILVATASGGAGQSSLDTVPADRVPATATVAPSVAPHRAIGGRGGLSPASGSTEGGAGTPGAVRATSLPTGLPTVPTGPPATPAGDALVLDAASTSSTHVVLPETVHPDYESVALTSTGTYGGVLFHSDDGTVTAGVAVLPVPGVQPSGSPAPEGAWREIGDFGELPAGGYTVYVFGDAATSVRVPVRRGETGLAVTATAPAEAVFELSRAQLGPTDTERDLRLPIEGDGGWTGLAGAWFGASGGQASSHFDGCLARRAQACDSGDPADTADSYVQVAGTSNVRLQVPPGFLAEPRDLVAHAELSAGTGAEIVAWYVLVRL